MTDLLDAVDALTQPIKSKVVQEKGGITCTSPVELPSLLEQLDGAIRGTIGIGGSGSLPNERNMLNGDALYRSVQITTLIRDWAASAKIDVRPTDKPADLLRTWYPRFTANPTHEDRASFYLHKMTSWAAQITAMFDPVKERDLPDECPRCGGKSWWRDGSEYYRPLVIRYKPDDPSTATASCRACDEVWGARELAFELESATRARVDGCETVSDVA